MDQLRQLAEAKTCKYCISRRFADAVSAASVVAYHFLGELSKLPKLWCDCCRDLSVPSCSTVAAIKRYRQAEIEA